MAFFEDSTNEQVNNSLWVEKYRPRTLDEYVGNEHLKEKVSDYCYEMQEGERLRDQDKPILSDIKTDVYNKRNSIKENFKCKLK